jgi:hypothetical protein
MKRKMQRNRYSVAFFVTGSPTRTKFEPLKGKHQNFGRITLVDSNPLGLIKLYAKVYFVKHFCLHACDEDR